MARIPAARVPAALGAQRRARSTSSVRSSCPGSGRRCHALPFAGHRRMGSPKAGSPRSYRPLVARGGPRLDVGLRVVLADLPPRRPSVGGSYGAGADAGSRRAGAVPPRPQLVDFGTDLRCRATRGWTLVRVVLRRGDVDPAAADYVHALGTARFSLSGERGRPRTAAPPPRSGKRYRLARCLAETTLLPAHRARGRNHRTTRSSLVHNGRSSDRRCQERIDCRARGRHSRAWTLVRSTRPCDSRRASKGARFHNRESGVRQMACAENT